MPRTSTAPADQILLFPQFPTEAEGPAAETVIQHPFQHAATRGTCVVLCGTYRKDPAGLQKTFEQLKDSGFTVLSPTSALIESEKQGFVYMRHEAAESPEQIENRHLDAIQKADFVWFFAPKGYVGPTGAMEVGFARANGIPVYSDTPLDDTTIKSFVQIVDSPGTVLAWFKNHQVLPPPPALTSFQHYYRQAALRRGYFKENAKDCLMLMVEEIGELARALRKRSKLARHGKPISNQEGLELADVFIYVVHMANILKIDLSKMVQQKELINIQKLLNAK